MAPALSSESKNQTVTLKTHLFALFSLLSNPHLRLLVTLDLRDCLSEIENYFIKFNWDGCSI